MPPSDVSAAALRLSPAAGPTLGAVANILSSLITTHYVLLTTHYLLGAVGNILSLLLTTYYLLLTTYYLLLTTYYSLGAVANILSFFISGLPGGVSYLLLAMVRHSKYSHSKYSHSKYSRVACPTCCSPW